MINVFTDMIGEVCTEINGRENNHWMIFRTVAGHEFEFSCNDDGNGNDCDVHVSDITGDMNDLLGSPILEAEEVSNVANHPIDDGWSTWTFYKFSTVKGSVTVCWRGTSNGYYSEKVDFIKNR